MSTPSRHRNDGLRKLCDCPRRTWAKCPHGWYFNFKWKGTPYRFSLDRKLGKKITSKTDAETEADSIRTAIRNNKFDMPIPVSETLTLAQLVDTYRKQYVAVHRPRTAKNVGYMVGVVLRTQMERPDGQMRAFGDWLVSDVSTDVIEQYRRVRLPGGATGVNRHLEVLRHLFNWATSTKRKLATENPFLDGSTPAVKLTAELPRKRRLRAGEGARLMAACTPHLWALVQAAIETGCRRGELLSLQWDQVRFEPKAELYLPAAKTKTKADRTIPMSSALRAILEMRRNGPDGKLLPLTAYVFGNEVGERVKDIKRAWHTAVLKAHGYKPTYVTKMVRGVKVRTGLLTPESQAQYTTIGLRFHDLRREAGSRWLDAGVPLHRIQKWLGHSSIAQTSTYLDADSAHDDDAMKRFEEQHARLQKIATEAGTGGHNALQSDSGGETKTRISSESLH